MKLDVAALCCLLFATLSLAAPVPVRQPLPAASRAPDLTWPD
jgi:hypothetical protein